MSGIELPRRVNDQVCARPFNALEYVYEDHKPPRVVFGEHVVYCQWGVDQESGIPICGTCGRVDLKPQL